VANLSSTAAADQLGNEKLTTLTNLNFDTYSSRNVQWFSRHPIFYHPHLPPGQAFRLQDSGIELSVRNILSGFPSVVPSSAPQRTSVF
jgi:hypothetical protein